VHYIVTGIGINVNNSEKLNQNTTDFKAATIEQLSGKKVNRSFLLSLFLQYFHEILKLFENEGSQEIIKEYRKHCSTLGRNVSVITRKGIFKGKAENISDKGELAVLTEKGETTFFSAGDVIHAPLSENL
jgi:BirA family biotin operon repressor/biotin-[acetyl-CoA-carboxylase] ligase